jgi:hypothetical protein
MTDTLYGYLSLATAATHLAAYPLWATLSTAQQTEALTQAFTHLEALRFQGTKTTLTQATAWPRTGVYVLGTLLADDMVPEAILRAQALEALACAAILADPAAQKRMAIQAQGVTEWDVSEAKEVYGTRLVGLLSPEAYACLRRLVTRLVCVRA